MTAIIFYARELQDTQAPGLSLRLEAGRASYGSNEFFCLGNGAKRVLLDRHIAADFMEALRRMNRHVRKGILLDKVFFNFDITDFDGVVLGVELGIKTGRPYIGLEAACVDVAANDLAYLDAACGQARYLAEGGHLGVASRIARTPRTGPRQALGRLIWEISRLGFAITANALGMRINMWQPTPRQMELIIEHAVAHMPASTTARMLGIEPGPWQRGLPGSTAPAEAAQAPLLVPETASPALLEVP